METAKGRTGTFDDHPTDYVKLFKSSDYLDILDIDRVGIQGDLLGTLRSYPKPQMPHPIERR